MYTPKDVCELGDHMLQLAAQLPRERAEQTVGIIELVLCAYAAEIGGFVVLEVQPDNTMEIKFGEPAPHGHPSKAH